MAYSLGDRFPPSPKYIKFLDPGAYQQSDERKLQINKIPFLSKKSRNTQPGIKIWTHAIYNVNIPRKIPNPAVMKSKCPRFNYKSTFKEEDLEKILCRCGIENICECPIDEEETAEIVCQAEVPKRLFKGITPRAMPEILNDGAQSELANQPKDKSPPFYNASVNYFTDFYKGCKWSEWTSKRATKSQEVQPGPADYTFGKEPNNEQICDEKRREHRRKTSKQLRFIEMVQRRNILEGRPGPATYTPNLPKGTELTFLGPKAERFIASKYVIHPGPADHWIKRDFSLPELIKTPCHAKLPERACFGNKASRFKRRYNMGPSPASYNACYRPCNIIHCFTGAFSSTTKRFNEEQVDNFSDNEELEEYYEPQKSECVNDETSNVTWYFKSKTKRFKPLIKKLNEPGPADMPQPIAKVKRTLQLQHVAPFFSSEGKFKPWYNWIPVSGKTGTPGPCYYSLEKPKCYPAVSRGPLIRAPRFPPNGFQNPPPNTYTVGGGIETILSTHNHRLKCNIENQHKYPWTPPSQPRKLDFKERELLLLNKAIKLLDGTELFHGNKDYNLNTASNINEETHKTKLLRCFLYNHQIPDCI